MARELLTIPNTFAAVRSCMQCGLCSWTPSFARCTKRASSGSVGIKSCAAYSPVYSYIQPTTPRSESQSFHTPKKLTIVSESCSRAFVISPNAPARAATSRRRTCALWELCATCIAAKVCDARTRSRSNTMSTRHVAGSLRTVLAQTAPSSTKC